MASIKLTFSAPLNTSCQVGDLAHAISYTDSGSFQESAGDMFTIGEIRQITGANTNTPEIICTTFLPNSGMVESKFILFSKNEAVNTSSILGYFGEAKYVCTDTGAAEIFSVSADIFESSK